MSCSRPPLTRRGVLLMLLASTLGGCGFRPLYASRGPHDWDPDLAAIVISPIRDRPGQVLALALRESLNPGGLSMQPRWRLETVLSISRADLGIQRNSTATSSEITVSASYNLIDYKSGSRVYTSSSRAISDFNQLNDAYATQVGAEDAQDRALQELAEEIAMRMALFVRQQRAKPASP